jgi:hypothetical protein
MLLNFGPGKRPEAEIINMIEDGWGDDPVHPSNATYEKIATAIISQEWLNVEPQVAMLPGLGLLADVPEWQKPQAAQIWSMQVPEKILAVFNPDTLLPIYMYTGMNVIFRCMNVDQCVYV